MTNAQAITADANYVVVEKPGNTYSKYVYTHNQGDRTQVVQPSPYVSNYVVVEPRILKDIDHFDSEISGVEKEIGKLLNL